MQQTSRIQTSSIQEGIDNANFHHSFEQEEKFELKNKVSSNSCEISGDIKVELNEANEILPAHKNFNDHKQKISFKLSSTTFYKQNSKLNQTAFPSINFKQRQKGDPQKIPAQPQVSLKQQMGEFAQFLSQKKSLIYQRIKNEKMNYLSRSQKIKQKSMISKPQAKYFCSLFINPKLGKNKSKELPLWEHLKEEYSLQNPQVVEDALKFDSHFQGGNLFAVFRDNSSIFPTYELFMQNDINTKGSTQWFFFKVSSKMRMKAKFRIINFYKANSLFQMGMKILVSADGIQWKRVGTAITYGKNQLSGKNNYFLEFIYEFQNSAKQMYFAYGYPYNYSQKLLPYIESLQSKNYSKKCIKKTVLCKSCMGNEVYLLSISNNIMFMKTQKPIIYVIGRQHAGETPSSFVVEGLINFLLSSRIQAQALREQFEFRIVPMVNVDGVISGNYRTNNSGNDVNRQWIFPSRNVHPQIYYIKQQIISNKRNVIFFLDIHAHSRKMNSFFYGSNEISKGNKFFPFVCSKLNKFISYSESSFGDDPSKMSTGRVVIQKQLNLVNSLTFQVSFYGWTDPVKKSKHHFKVSELEQIGMSLALGLYYCEVSIKKVQDLTQSNLSKRTQKQKTIYKNSLKIYEKWKSQLQKQVKKDQQVLSQGSSIDPEQFTLKKQEILNIQCQNSLLNQNQQSNKNQKDGLNQIKQDFAQQYMSNSVNQMNSYQHSNRSKRYSKSMRKNIYGNRIYGYEDELNEEQSGSGKKSNLFSYSGNQFFMMSSKNVMVRQLQNQLQMNGVSKDKRYRSIDEQKLIKRNIQIDFKQTYRYQDKIKQIHKVFNYCLNNDDKVDHYQSFYKSFTPRLENLNTTRNFSVNERNNNSKHKVDSAKKTKVHFLKEKQKQEFGDSQTRRNLVALRSLVK